MPLMMEAKDLRPGDAILSGITRLVVRRIGSPSRDRVRVTTDHGEFNWPLGAAFPVVKLETRRQEAARDIARLL